MKRILIILLVLIGLLAGGGYFLFLKAITPGDVPTKVMNAEEAISTSGTIAISSIDIGHVRRIDDMFKGVKDPSPLSAPQQEPKSAKSLLAKLNKQGINLYKTTDYALATINVGQEKPAYTFVLFGRYSSNKLKQAIRQSHLVDESTKGYWLITPKVEEKKITDPCAVPDSSADKSALNVLQIKLVLMCRSKSGGHLEKTKWWLARLCRLNRLKKELLISHLLYFLVRFPINLLRIFTQVQW